MTVLNTPAVGGGAVVAGSAAGASGEFTGGGGIVDTAQGAVGALPFTGIGLYFTVLAGITLLITGFTLVRIARTVGRRTA
jgi:hypothetical protein